MDVSTFGNPVIAKYMSENYYAVKFNAEGKDTINFAGNTFVNQIPDASRSTHQFARALLDNQMGYPKFVVFNNKIERMSIIPGYHTAKDFDFHPDADAEVLKQEAKAEKSRDGSKNEL